MPKPGEYDNSYPKLLEIENKIKLLEPFIGSKKHHKMQCLVCDHKWTATPISKRQTLKKHNVCGCPNCNTNRREQKFKETRNLNIIQLKERGIEILTPMYDGRRHIVDHNTYTKVTVKNTNCGHTFECSPSNLLSQHVECAVCGPTKRIAPLTAWSKSNSAKWKKTASEWELYKSEVTSLTERAYKKHSKYINPKKLPRGKAGVDGAFHLDHIVPKRFCFENNIPAALCADPTNLQMVGWRDNVGSRNHLKGSIPHIFLQYIDDNSRIQHYITILQNSNNNFKQFEIVHGITSTLYDSINDVVILILPISKPYSNQKTGILALKKWTDKVKHFFIIFEDELNTNLDIVINKIKHYTNQNTRSVRIHGRQCDIREIDKKHKTVFLNQFHIQGSDNAMLSYGAFFDNNLIAVMTFSKPRVALGYKNKNREVYDSVWELSRFATNTNYRIPGIGSKLLKNFHRNVKCSKLISYADKRWSVGNLYDKLGFMLEKNNPPSYHYIIDGVRKHRWNYRKDMLKNTLSEYDSSLTEYQNMENAGYWRVWDCGTLRYVI